MTMLVTGANGFLGRAVCAAVLATGATVWGVTRRMVVLPEGVQQIIVPGLDENTDWTQALVACDVVVHCAARVHVMNEAEIDPLASFRRVNVRGTLRLARQAAQAGVRRFVFISSIGVNGNQTFARPFAANDLPNPRTPYAVSKYEAELGLQALSNETGMEVVIIRPPMVYGFNAPGNFASLMRWLNLGVPLPLGAVTNNRRSFIFLDNLISLIIACAKHPEAANQIFLASDGESLSTVSLLQRLGFAMRRPARLIPVPVDVLNLGARLIRRTGMAQRLCGSLEVDIGKTRSLLAWSPPVTVDEGLRRTAEHWLGEHEACI